MNTAPIVLKSDGNTQNYLYLQRDYQGSIVAISDATGQVLEKRLFDAWGNVLVQDGAGNTLSGLTVLDRGYTGHEHLQSVGLIHMNGRLYDPKLHRFLQPDNYVQDPNNTQNYNRYGYCWNNPLKYTDPSGEFTWSDLVAGVAIVVGTALVIWGGPAGVALGWKMIGSGTAHFLGTFAMYASNGYKNWDKASNYIGLSSPSININTGWGDSKPDKNGINQSAPVVKPKSDTDGNGGGQGGNLSPAQQAQIKARNEAQHNFYGVDIRIIPSFFGGGSYYAGAINIPKYMWDTYKRKGLDSYEGRFLMHEYGHFLQEKHSPLWYNTYAAPASLVNAIFNNQSEHAKHWAEIQASTYAWYYFGFPKDFKKENEVNSNYLSLQIRKSIFRQYLKN